MKFILRSSDSSSRHNRSRSEICIYKIYVKRSNGFVE